MVATTFVRRCTRSPYRQPPCPPSYTPAVHLVLIRHALPIRLEATDGPADPPLADLGLRQAEVMAEALATERFDALYSSPLLRARQTAEPLARTTGLEPTIVDGVAEWDRNASAYVPLEQLREERPDVMADMVAGRWDALGIDMEGFVERVTSAFATIAASHRGERVGVVCHGGVINVYLSRVLGLDRLLFFEPGYTSISRVGVADVGAGILSLNETGHLRGLPGNHR